MFISYALAQAPRSVSAMAWFHGKHGGNNGQLYSHIGRDSIIHWTASVNSVPDPVLW